MQEQLFLIGIALIFIGIFIIVIASLLSGSSKVEYGVGGLIGIIPFGFGNSPRIVYTIIALSLISLVILFLLNR